MVDIPGAADIQTGTLSPPSASSSSSSTNVPATTGAPFDISSLPDVVKNNASAAMDATKNYISAAHEALPALHSLNSDFRTRLSTIQTEQDQLYSNIIDANKKLEYTAANPFSQFLGLFNSDYNPEYQRARITSGTVSLAALKSQLDTTALAHNLAVQDIQDTVNLTGKQADAALKGNDVINSVLQTQENLLNFKDIQLTHKMETMTPDEIKADPSIPVALKNNELTRRQSQQLALSNLALQNKGLQETQRLVDLHKADLNDPAVKAQYTPQELAEEANRRTSDNASAVGATERAVEAKVKTRLIQLDEVANSSTTPQVIAWHQAAEKNGGSVEVKTPTGETVTFTTADTQAMLNKRLDIDKATEKRYGDLAANRASIGSPMAAGTTIAQNLKNHGLLSTSDLLELHGYTTQAQAYIQSHDLEDAKKVIADRLTKAQGLLTAAVQRYDKPSQNFVYQFLRTDPKNFSSLSQGDAAQFLVSQAVNGDSLLKGTAFSDVGPALVQNIMSIVNSKRGLLGNLSNGKIDLNALFSSGKFDASEIMREALAKPIPGTVSHDNPQGTTIQQHIDNTQFIRYLSSRIEYLSKAGNQSVELNPFKMLTGPDGRFNSALAYDGNGEFSKKVFMTKLADLNSQLHAQGRLGANQDLSQIVISALNDTSAMKTFGDQVRSQYTIPQAAIATLVAGGREEFALPGQIQDLQQNSRTIQDNVLYETEQNAYKNDIAKGWIDEFNQNMAPAGADPAKLQSVQTKYGTIIYDPKRPNARKNAEALVGKLDTLTKFGGAPFNFGNTPTAPSNGLIKF